MDVAGEMWGMKDKWGLKVVLGMEVEWVIQL